MGLYVGGLEASGVYVGPQAASAAYVGGKLAWSAAPALPEHATLAEYTLAELKEVSADLTANGASSAAYGRFYGFLGQEYDFGARTGAYAGSGQDAHVIAQLVGICHDDLADGTGKAGLTFLCARALQYAYQMNASDTNSGGWASSKMRATLNSGEVWQSLPEDLKDAAAPVLKLTNNTGQASDASAVTATSDRLWLASGAELYGPTIGATWASESRIILPLEGSQYGYLSSLGVKPYTYAPLGNRNQTNTGGNVQDGEVAATYKSRAWLRSPLAHNASSFVMMSPSSAPNGISASYGSAVNLGFCI